ncbi:MAG: GtrA family protein [Frankiales bacterium]|nr:GtrA family protein [Frankiales bacterium]
MPRTLTERLRGIGSELWKFVVVGGFCFVLDTALSTGLFNSGVGPTTSKTVSTIVATGVSYLGNRLWSFAHRVDDERGHGQDITVYGVINVIGLVITLIPVDVTHYLLSETSTLAFTMSSVVGTGIATVFRFWAYRKYVFVHDKDLAERTALV